LVQGKLVDRVETGSIAEELGICSGDRIVAVNGKELGDVLDWRLTESDEELLIAVQHMDGELVEYEIEKDYDESLGIIFDSPTLDEIRPCKNRCVFCFVDQLPPGMRETLQIKDDDYRLSFLSGSYITLTNLSEADLQRIMHLHLSPLYVSVHTTNPQLRRRMLGNRQGSEILPILKKLADAGIEFHTQIVLCPGLNDGKQLEQTLDDLFSMYPGVRSLAVVPVGLTGHRDRLYPLSPYDAGHARAVLSQLSRWQERCMAAVKTRFVFASDEFYTMAGQDVPQDDEYEDYPQLENGVGMVRLLYNAWDRWCEKLPARLTKERSATVATGASAACYLEPIISRLNEISGLTVNLKTVPNQFFGGHVTVSGLLTYRDLTDALSKEKVFSPLYLPAVMLKEGRDLFLDGHTAKDLAETLGVEVRVVDSLDSFLQFLFAETR
jgi:putative radical SAM enzyme (TIGR03279 family)